MDGDQTNANFTAAGLAAIEPALQGVVDAGDLSGFVTLIWRKGEIVQVNTVGHRDIAASLPMTRDTLFRIASMTKPVTSVAALMLMEEGKLSLEDPVTKWLPELAGMRVMKDPEGAIDDTYPGVRPRSATGWPSSTARTRRPGGWTTSPSRITRATRCSKAVAALWSPRSTTI